MKKLEGIWKDAGREGKAGKETSWNTPEDVMEWWLCR